MKKTALLFIDANVMMCGDYEFDRAHDPAPNTDFDSCMPIAGYSSRRDRYNENEYLRVKK